MIPAAKLIADFQYMYREHWRYEWGAAQRGCVDCSGAFVYAYNLHGLSIAHGSNAIARNYVERLEHIADAIPGMAAFKARVPGQAGYDLPEKYRTSGDLRDFYHIGLVDSTGKYVLNAKSTQAGFSRDPISKWSVVGRLKAVSYNEQEKGGDPMQMMVVCTEGKTVRLRSNPSTSAKVITEIRAGTVVSAGDVGNPDWYLVRWDGKAGYMMKQFLAKVQDDESEPGDGMVTISLPESAAIALRDALISALGAG